MTKTWSADLLTIHREALQVYPSGRPRQGQSVLNRVLGRCELVGECWEYLGNRDWANYGRTFYQGRMTNTHRIVYIELVGPIAPGMCVCHACDNPPCVNPSHLFLGTHRDNMRDMAAKGRRADPWATRERPPLPSTCGNGHAYTTENTAYRPNGRPRCRECARDNARRSRARKVA